jgi:hypothetical protein
VVLKERDIEKGYIDREVGESSRIWPAQMVTRRTREREAELGGDHHFEGNWGLHFWDAHGSAGNRK